MDRDLRELVRRRAGERCEYCRLQQRHYPDFNFHIEHVVARQHRGETEAGNLALSCHHCNLKKGPNLAGLDPKSGKLTALFHPREQLWEEHFEESENGEIRGRTAIGRATVEVLGMNEEVRIQIRRQIGAEHEE